MTDYLDPTVVAAPLFLLCIVWEWRVLVRRQRSGRDVAGYEKADTWVNLGMGLGSLVTVGLLNLAIYGLARWAWHWRLIDLGNSVPGWVAAILGWDLLYYWTHRFEHEVRVFWAAHVNHHSSARYNLSTALRQPWTPLLNLGMFPLLAFVGVRPWMIMVSGGFNLIYQYWIHTEAIDRMPGWFEAVLNTPSHHRVHHGSNPQYIDKNYGGILIVWDRWFGTFEPEVDRVRYGLTEAFDTHNLLVTVFHEYAALGRDIRHAARWRDRAGHLVHGPKWQPARVAEPLA